MLKETMLLYLLVVIGIIGFFAVIGLSIFAVFFMAEQFGFIPALLVAVGLMAIPITILLNEVR